ncbi:MAG: hypothetical protein ACOZQL_32940 [Myxococcota bacterium]
MPSELTSAVEQQRVVVTQLEGELAPRRRQEQDALAALERSLAELSRRRADADQRLNDATAARRQLTSELARLEEGLDRAQRAWARLVVPVTAAALLLLALVSVGVAQGRSWWLVGACLAAGVAFGRRGGRDA